MDEKISVVIPSYNRAGYVTKAIDSVLAQTCGEFEIIIVDDGSIDNTREVLAPYGDKIIYHYQENKGIAGARNAGIRRVTGTFVAFLDSDDYWVPEKTGRQLELFAQHPAYGIVASQCASVRLDGSYREKNRPGKSGHVLTGLFEKNFIRTSSAMIRRTCFDRIGLFDEALVECEEYDLWLRLAAQFEVGFINESLAVYIDNPDGISTDSLQGRLFRLQVLEKDYLKQRIPPAVYNRRIADTCHYIGRHYLRRGKKREGIDFLLRAQRLHPLYVKNLAHLALGLMRGGHE